MIKEIPGCPGYAASDDGKIWTKKNGRYGFKKNYRPLTRSAMQGYNVVTIFINDKYRTVKVAPLILLTFVGPRPERLDACHNDGDRANDSLSNLRWDTRSANMNDAIRHGTYFTEGRVRAIQTMHDAWRARCQNAIIK